MAAISKRVGTIQIVITLLGFVFLGGANYQQAQETRKRTEDCEKKIEILNESQANDSKRIQQVIGRLEVAIAKLETQIEFITQHRGGRQ